MNAIDIIVRDQLYKWLLQQPVYNVPKELIDKKRVELYKAFLNEV